MARPICLFRTLSLGLTALLLSGSALAADPPSWYLGFRTTSYAYQRQAPGAEATDEISSWQHFSGTATRLADGRLTVRGSGRFTRGVPEDTWGLEKSKLYSGHLEARFGPAVKARLGRQWLTSGAANLTLDGAHLAYQAGSKLELTAWGGARTPYTYGYEVGRLDDTAAAGGRVSYSPRRGVKVGLSAAYLEDRGAIAERPVALELSTTLIRNVRAFGRASYDLEQDRLARLDLQGQWRGRSGGPVVGLQYIDRHPSIAANSWFARFGDLARIRLLRGTARYEWPSLYGGEFEYLGSFTDGRTANRFGLALLAPFGRVGYSLRVGDVGDENSLYGEVFHQVWPWLRVDAQATLLTYALVADAPAADERDLITFSAGLKADLRPGARLSLAVQSLENPFYNKDVRFLMGLDLAMARGSSRLGLDRGGWLR